MDTYMDSLIAAVPAEERKALDNLSELRKQKLWHQFGVELVALCSKENSPLDSHLIELHAKVVSKVSKSLDSQQYVRFCLAVSRQHKDLKASEAFLEEISKEIGEDVHASLLCQMERVRVKVKQGQFKPAKALLEEGLKTMKNYAGIVEASVQAHAYLAAMEYNAANGPAADYYRYSLLYLTYTPLETISIPQQQDLAAKVSLAAVSGEGIYNFGELLQHPVLIKLHDTPQRWISELLRAFNEGNIQSFRSIHAEHKTELKSDAFLNQKIRIMALVDMIFRQPSHSKPVPFAEIAKNCEVEVLQVEHLVMKSFALGVLKGDIDQVAQTVRVKWVQPRVLDVKQLASINVRLTTWSKQVNDGATYLENNAPELLSMHPRA